MKKLLFSLLFVLFLPALAHAANCSPFTYTLTNGTTADANQVMSNFNNLLSCGNNNLAGLAQPNTFAGVQTYQALNAYDSAAGTQRGTLFQSSASSRWSLFVNTTAESGANAGSNFEIDRFDDMGALLDAPFEITRSTGVVILLDGLSVLGPVTLSSALPIAQGGTGATTAAAARTALGLGTAATQNTGTSGANVPLLNGVNTWAAAQTFTVAPVFTDQSGSRTALGLGTAATQNTGTSGATLPFLNGTNTWAAAQTFTTAPVFTDQSGSRTALGLGTAATVNTGTSGATIPLLNGANTWSGAQSFNSGDVKLKGATSGTITVNAAAIAGANTLTLPAGTTDFSATGGASQVVKQTSAGGALTVGQLAFTDVSGHVQSTGTTPAITAGGTDCGTSPSAVGNDSLFRITVGSSTNGSKCTVTFAAAWTNAPACRPYDETGQSYLGMSAVNTTTLVIVGTLVAGDKVSVICQGYF